MPLNAAPDISGELAKWHPITITFDGPASNESADPNPFTDYRLNVTFTNGTETYVVPGYYAADGDAANTGATSGNQWRVHFTPDAVGAWDYSVSFRSGTGINLAREGIDPEPADAADWQPLHGTTGSIEVGPSDKVAPDFRALGRIIYTNEHYFRYAGTLQPFVKTGMDSPENFLGYAEFDQTFKDPNPPKLSTNKTGPREPLGIIHEYANHLSDWQPGDPVWTQLDGVAGSYGKSIIGAVNFLASQKVNSIYFLTYNIDSGDGADTWPWRDITERLRFDCSKLDQWNIVFTHMQEKGVMLYVIQQERENDRKLGPEEANKDGSKDYDSLNDGRKLYYRELIARFAHHPGLAWNIGEENTNRINRNVNNPSLFAEYIRSLDPYDHPIGIHSGNDDSVLGMAEDFYGNPNFEFMSMQADVTYYKGFAEEIRYESDLAGRPFILWGDEQNPGVNDTSQYRKYGVWEALMSGIAGVEWYAGGDDQDLDDFGASVVTEKLRDYRAARFFLETLADPSNLTPDHTLATNTSSSCLALDGIRYVVYLREGGTTELDLSAAALSDIFSVRWFNPRDGGPMDNGARLLTGSVVTVQGGGMRSLGDAPADSSEDWVVFITRTTPGGGVTFGDWANSLDEIPTAPTPEANPDLDRWSLLQEYAFDLDPSEPDAPHFPAGFETSGSDHYFQYEFRWNSSASDLVRTFEISDNLLDWNSLTIDGINAMDQIVESDPDNDGSAEQRQVEVQVTGQDQLFLRLNVELE